MSLSWESAGLACKRLGCESPALHNKVWEHACDRSPWEVEIRGSEVQSPQVHSKLEASFGYLRLSQKKSMYGMCGVLLERGLSS